MQIIKLLKNYFKFIEYLVFFYDEFYLVLIINFYLRIFYQKKY